MNPILLAIVVVTVIGLIGAVILVAASIFMYVPVDERVEKITAVLAGANCGACGCAGCADYAKSIVEDGNAVNKCTPGGAACAAKVAEIMGVEAGSSVAMKAVVACSGTCEKTSKKYEFEGISSCQAVKGFYGGDGMCKYGCLGYGDCVRACAFDAIHVDPKLGIAQVDRAKCVGCGACAAACPNSIISIVPEHKRKPVVLCQNKDKGADTRKACTAGCIGCMKCAKACPKEAITVENFLAKIDQDKCVSCGMCLVSCPFGAIVDKGQIFQLVQSLRNGEKVIAIVAPAFISQFPGLTPDKVKAAMRELGFADTVEVAIGADLCTIEEAKDFLNEVP